MNSIQNGDYAREIYRTEGSVRVEQEVILPDYCPDIMRLIRVEMTPVFEKSRAYLQDNILVVETSGRAEFTALYSDGDGVESYSFTDSFNCTLKKDMGRGCMILPESLALSVTPISASVSPRVMSPRKLLARGEIKMCVEVFANIGYSSYSPVEDMAASRVDVECEDKCISRVVSSKSEDFTLSQEIKLPSSLPPCAKVLSCTANMCVDSVHPASDSASVFLTANFNVLYLSEETGEREAELVSFCQPIEVREVLECDDCAEDCICRITASLKKPECGMLVDNYGENRAFSLDLPYTLNCTVFENLETPLVSDVYGVGCNASCERSGEEFMRYIGTLSESCPLREKLLVKSDGALLKGACAVAVVKGAGVNSEGVWADVMLEVSAVEIGEEGMAKSFSDSLEMRIPLNVPESIMQKTSPELLSCDVHIIPSWVDMQVSSGDVDLSGELAVRVGLWEKCPSDFVSGVEFSERETRQGKTVFYYPTCDDTLWDVGRRYGVERAKIREANGFEGDELPAVIRIP